MVVTVSAAYRRIGCLGRLINYPLTNFTKAKSTLQTHSTQATHKAAMEDTVAFTSRIEKGRLSVSQLLQSEASTCVKHNREKILSILKTVVFCGKQNIALRGHREEDGGTGQNPGNFLALLQFRIDSGDVVLANHFEESPRNAQYRSPGIQNELISCTGEWIRKQIIQEVVEASFFFFPCVLMKHLILPTKSNFLLL